MSESVSAAIEGAGEHVENDSPEYPSEKVNKAKEICAEFHSRKIQRYGAQGEHYEITIEPSEAGAYVKYDDHIAALVNPLGTKLCRDMPAFYRLLQFVLDNIADLEQSPEFAGFKMQRAVNDEGELQFIRLVPCDKIGDITSPRYADEQPNKVIKAAVASTLKLVKP